MESLSKAVRPPLRVVVSEEPSIAFNLALEQSLLRSWRCPTLFIYKNEDCIVIGKHQNPWLECDVLRSLKEGVSICKRESGGGAVFQDSGNTCFSLIGCPNRDASTGVVLRALQSIGIDATPSGRNDILMGDKKISGSAFQKYGDVEVHHGTILRNVNLEKMQTLLTPPLVKLEAHGVPSVRSRVANIGLSHKEVEDALVKAFTCPNVGTPVERITASCPKSIEFWKAYTRLSDMPRVFKDRGELLGTHRFGFGTLSLCAYQGKVHVHTDSLDPEVVNILSEGVESKDWSAMKPYLTQGEWRLFVDWMSEQLEKVKSPSQDIGT